VPSKPDTNLIMKIAMGSASELEYELLLAHEFGFVGRSEHAQLSQATEEIKRMLTAFFRKLTAECSVRPPAAPWHPWRFCSKNVDPS
jgi:hypothetical protein